MPCNMGFVSFCRMYSLKLLEQRFIKHLSIRSRSMSYHSIREIYLTTDTSGKTAEVKGWVKSLRKMKDNVFIDIDDGTWPVKLQVVVPKKIFPEGLTYGSSVTTRGKLVINPQNQPELIPDNIDVVGSCNVIDGYPFAPRKTYPSEYSRQFIHMRPRTQTFSSLLRIRHCASQALNQYFTDKGFIKIDVPILTSNDCEGAGEIFTVKPDSDNLTKGSAKPEEAFFNGKAFLTVSGQLHLEVTARALRKVYCFGPTFRAENSKSRLHLSEFYMTEAELAFTTDLNDVITLIEDFVKSTTQRVLDMCQEDINNYIKKNQSESMSKFEHLLSTSYTIDSYNNVCNLLQKHNSQFSQPLKIGNPLSKEHELYLVKLNNNVPIFVVDWPSELKPFYMKNCENDSSKVHAIDLLCQNVGELCGGSLREDSYELLYEKLKNVQLEDKLSWYLELRKFGNVPTGGFGMGFERYLQVLLGIPNIKDAIPFPRWPHNCKL